MKGDGLQWVWWGLLDWSFTFHRYKESENMYFVYKWLIRIGPLEIRRWQDKL